MLRDRAQSDRIAAHETVPARRYSIGVEVFMRRFMGMILPAMLVLLPLLVLGCRTNQLPETQAKDVQITAKIKGKLASEVRLATVTNVDVNTTNGVVTLSGTVSSPEEKEKVQTIAKSVEGVKSVNNNLQVAVAPSS
jgi:hypothetical protein